MLLARELSALGAAVKAYRARHGLTQVVLKQRSGVSPIFLQALEKGRRRVVTAADISALAVAMECPEEELWELIPGGRTTARYIPLYPPDAWPLSPGLCSTAIPGMARCLDSV